MDGMKHLVSIFLKLAIRCRSFQSLTIRLHMFPLDQHRQSDTWDMDKYTRAWSSY